MAALTLDTLLRSLRKSSPDPVYLLYGDEDVLKLEAIRALVEGIGTKDFNLDTRYAADLTPEAFHALVNTPPMFAERRAVIVRGVEHVGKRKSKLREEMLRYLASPSPTTLLILVVSAGEELDPELAKSATAVELERLPAERVVKWLNHHARSLGLSIAPDAAKLLLDSAGNDLGTLSRELEKLASLGRPATAEDVTGLVGVRRGETILDLVEAAMERRVARASQLVDPVLEQAGLSGVRIIMLLGTHLVGTALARAERDRGGGGWDGARLEDAVYHHMQAARPYGLRTWREEAKRWVKWSALWTAPELERALRAALKADVALKTATVTDDRGIVKQLLLGFAVVRREAA